MKLFLDDIRNPPAPGWKVFRTAEELISFIMKDLGGNLGQVEALSLDHDLGEGRMSGYDFLAWVEKALADGRLSGFCPSRVHIHSANPVGVKNMQAVLAAIERHFAAC